MNTDRPRLLSLHNGAKVQPTLNFTPRLRAWLTAGIGWGRFTFPEMTFTENEQEFVVRQRNSVFVEFPLGLGVSYDIIEDWLALEFESTAAPWAVVTSTPITITVSQWRSPLRLCVPRAKYGCSTAITLRPRSRGSTRWPGGWACRFPHRMTE